MKHKFDHTNVAPPASQAPPRARLKPFNCHTVTGSWEGLACGGSIVSITVVMKNFHVSEFYDSVTDDILIFLKLKQAIKYFT